jgi:hypothetical protein
LQGSGGAAQGRGLRMSAQIRAGRERLVATAG